MVKDHWVREETHCRCLMGYPFLLAARDLLYALFYRQDSIYHGFCYARCAALAGMRNSSMGHSCTVQVRILSRLIQGCLRKKPLWIWGGMKTFQDYFNSMPTDGSMGMHVLRRYWMTSFSEHHVLCYGSFCDHVHGHICNLLWTAN